MKTGNVVLSMFFILAVLSFRQGVALASEDTVVLPPVVVTPTMVEKNLDKAPGAVQVIDSEEIAALGAETVADALLYATGVMVTIGEGRNLGTSIRGLGRNHTLVLLDGRRLAGSFKSQMDVGQLPVLMIERIEIVRGPASALYGSDAIGGVVNIITRDPAKNLQGAIDIRGGVGPSAEQSVQGRVGGGYGPLRANLGVSRSIKDQWDGDGELAEDIDQTALNSTLGRLALDLNDSQSITLGGEYGHLSRNGGRFYQKLARRFEADDRRWSGFAQYDLQTDGALSGMLRGYVSQYKRTGSYDPAYEVDAERRRLMQVEMRGNYAVYDDLLFTLGGEFREDNLKAGGLDGDDKSVHNEAVFLQADWQLGRYFNLVAGGRYDHHEDFGSRLTPRVTLSCFIPCGRVWVGYGQGFRAPTLNELYVTSLLKQGKEIYQGNADLDAETSESYEAGVSLRKGRLWGQLTLYRNELKNLITAQFISQSGSKKTYEYRNIDKVVTQGTELEAGIGLPGNLSLSGQLAWLDTENLTTDTDLANEPHWKGGLNLTWRQTKWDLTARLRWLHFGESEDDLGETIEDYNTVHLHLDKGLSRRMRVYAGIDNLFDNYHDDYTQSPRQFYAGLQCQF